MKKVQMYKEKNEKIIEFLNPINGEMTIKKISDDISDEGFILIAREVEEIISIEEMNYTYDNYLEYREKFSDEALACVYDKVNYKESVFASADFLLPLEYNIKRNIVGFNEGGYKYYTEFENNFVNTNYFEACIEFFDSDEAQDILLDLCLEIMYYLENDINIEESISVIETYESLGAVYDQLLEYIYKYIKSEENMLIREKGLYNKSLYEYKKEAIKYISDIKLFINDNMLIDELKKSKIAYIHNVVNCFSSIDDIVIVHSTGMCNFESLMGEEDISHLYIRLVGKKDYLQYFSPSLNGSLVKKFRIKRDGTSTGRNDCVLSILRNDPKDGDTIIRLDGDNILDPYNVRVLRDCFKSYKINIVSIVFVAKSEIDQMGAYEMICNYIKNNFEDNYSIDIFEKYKEKVHLQVTE